MKTIKFLFIIILGLPVYFIFRYFERKPRIITESVDFINRTVKGTVIAGRQKVFFTQAYSAKSSGKWYVIENYWIDDDVYRISITANSNLVKKVEVDFKSKTIIEKDGIYSNKTPIFDILFRT